MDETVERQNEKLLNDLLTSKKNIEVLRKNHWKLYAMSHDSGMMVQSEVITTLAGLEETLLHPSNSNKVGNYLLASWWKSKKLSEFLLTDGIWSFRQLLKEPLK